MPPEELVTGASEGSYIEPATGGEAASAADAPSNEGVPRGAADREVDPPADGGGEGGEGDAPKPYESKSEYKYRVMQKEKQIPEKFRALIQNEADEKEIRELFEKADGLEEHFKPKHEALQKSFSQVQAEHNFMLGHIDEARQAFQRGDMDAFFDKLQVPQQKVMEYVLQKLNYQELPPDQKAMVDARRNAERQVIEQQRQQQYQYQSFQQQVQNAHDSLLNSELARPEVKSAMEGFDQRMSRPGAFMDEVIKRGKYEAAISNGRVILTPSQAIEAVMSLYELKGGAPASASSAVVPPASGNVTGNKQNTMTNVGGGKSSAPLKQKPRSIEDLKKMRDEMIAREA